MNSLIAEYFKRLRIWQSVQVYVHRPYFNVAHEPTIWSFYLRESAWLKEQADALWHQGVNVYL